MTALGGSGTIIAAVIYGLAWGVFAIAAGWSYPEMYGVGSAAGVLFGGWLYRRHRR